MVPSRAARSSRALPAHTQHWQRGSHDPALGAWHGRALGAQPRRDPSLEQEERCFAGLQDEFRSPWLQVRGQGSPVRTYLGAPTCPALPYLQREQS